GLEPGVIRNVKPVVKDATLTGAWYQAAAASLVPPSVNSSKDPFSFALPTRFIPPLAKPLPKLIELPDREITYMPLATWLLLIPLTTAIAERVSVAATETGPVYFVLLVVGVVPSVV